MYIVMPIMEELRWRKGFAYVPPPGIGMTVYIHNPLFKQKETLDLGHVFSKSCFLLALDAY
jgi:hypothetical protein